MTQPRLRSFGRITGHCCRRSENERDTMKTRSVRMLTTVVVLSAVALAHAGGKSAKDKYGIMEGVWVVKTVGKTGNWGQDVKALAQEFKLTFLGARKGPIVIEGNPFGFAIVKSDIACAKKGGGVKFETVYKRDKEYSIQWVGKLDDEGTKITVGQFSFVLGTGSFTAEKQEQEKQEK